MTVNVIGRICFMLGIIGFDFAWPLDVGETYSGLQRTQVGDMEFNFVIGQGF